MRLFLSHVFFCSGCLSWAFLRERTQDVNQRTGYGRTWAFILTPRRLLSTIIISPRELIVSAFEHVKTKRMPVPRFLQVCGRNSSRWIVVDRPGWVSMSSRVRFVLLKYCQSWYFAVSSEYSRSIGKKTETSSRHHRSLILDIARPASKYTFYIIQEVIVPMPLHSPYPPEHFIGPRHEKWQVPLRLAPFPLVPIFVPEFIVAGPPTELEFSLLIPWASSWSIVSWR